MVEDQRCLQWASHALLVVCVVFLLLPLYVAVTSSTQTVQALMQAPIPLWPGSHAWHNYSTVLSQGLSSTGGVSLASMLWNSLIMALCIAIGKISVSILSAYAIVYFHFPWRKLCFWLIFLTLMLPVEVRILPTFEVTARLHLLNSFAGLSLPLMASATATFLFRQFFLTIPDELIEAARLDGAGPLRILKDIILPLSKTNIAALFIILFIYGWNQYLWPLVVTTDPGMQTVVMGLQQLAHVADQMPQWPLIMAIVILSLLPPLLVIVALQRLFEKGLLEAEK